MDALRSWYACYDYAETPGIRQTALERRPLFVPGVDPAPE